MNVNNQRRKNVCGGFLAEDGGEKNYTRTRAGTHTHAHTHKCMAHLHVVSHGGNYNGEQLICA